MSPDRSGAGPVLRQLVLLDAERRVVALQAGDATQPAGPALSGLRPGDRIDEHLERLAAAGVPLAIALHRSLSAATAAATTAADIGSAGSGSGANGQGPHAVEGPSGAEPFAWVPLQQPPGWSALLIEPGRAEGHQRQRLEELVVDRTVQLAAARESAEQARSSQTEFLAHMSHEVRTPLNAIAGLTHLMRREPGLTEALGRRLADVQSAARHLQAIVDDVLDLERLESGEVALRDEPFDLHTLLDEVRALVQGEADLSGVGLQVEQAAPTTALRGDGPRLRQALLNLAAHAVRHGNQVGVTLRSRVPVRGDSGVLLRLEVHDAAAGARPSGPAGLGGRTGDAAPRLRDQGGLGLALTRRLAQRMGGVAGIDVLGDGGSLSWFSVRVAEVQLPVEPRRSPVVGLEGVIRQRHGGARVLLAEDNEVNRLVMVELLADAGLQVDTAEDGEQALVMAGQRPYDLVLLDLRMPRRDGLSAAREMRRMPALRRVPIMATTANAFDEDRRACAAAGMDDFLAKPIEVDLLYELVLSWLDRTRGSPPAADAGLPAQDAPADADGQRLMQMLRGVEGIDAGGGLAAVGGRAAVYRRLLGVFCRTHHDDAARLAACVERGDLAGARDLAHRIRGGAATLGLVDIELTAADVESTLDAGRPARAMTVSDGLQRFGTALHETLARVELALSR